jgi:hypothetical protein
VKVRSKYGYLVASPGKLDSQQVDMTTSDNENPITSESLYETGTAVFLGLVSVRESLLALIIKESKTF